MPQTPKGHKRPADVISNAVHVMRLATGEIKEDDTPNTPDTDGTKDQSALALGRKGGHARAAALSRTKRKRIAKEAAVARWSKRRKR